MRGAMTHLLINTSRNTSKGTYLSRKAKKWPWRSELRHAKPAGLLAAHLHLSTCTSSHQTLKIVTPSHPALLRTLHLSRCLQSVSLQYQIFRTPLSNLPPSRCGNCFPFWASLCPTLAIPYPCSPLSIIHSSVDRWLLIHARHHTS